MLECKNQNGNIVTVCRNYPANTGLHGAYTINSFLKTLPVEIVGTLSCLLAPLNVGVQDMVTKLRLTALRGRRGAREGKKQRLVQVSQLLLSAH